MGGLLVSERLRWNESNCDGTEKTIAKKKKGRRRTTHHAQLPVIRYLNAVTYSPTPAHRDITCGIGLSAITAARMMPPGRVTVK